MQNIRCNKEAIKEAAEISGGVKELAEKIRVSYQSVINWRAGKTRPSPFNCIQIEEATNKKITRKDILPDYPWEKFK